MLLVAVGLVACDGVLTPPAAPTLEQASAVLSGRQVTPTRTLARVQLTPIPPTATFTLSPTPTPVVHIVEQGDTLLGVALDYGITLDALLAANTLDVTDYLRIGQPLIIPLTEESRDIVGGVPLGNLLLPTPTPLPVEPVGVAMYRTPVGGIWCLGGVENTTDGPLTNIQVQVTLIMEDGTPLATTVVLAAADYLQHGQIAPFSALFTSPPEGVADAQAMVLRAESIGPITAGFVPLEILSVEGAVSGPQYRVRGRLANGSSVGIAQISVVAVIFDEAGRVLGYRQSVQEMAAMLAPGQESTFDLLLTSQKSGAPSAFQVLAWGVSE